MKLTSAVIAGLGGIALFGAVIASAAPKKGPVPQATRTFDADIARYAQANARGGQRRPSATTHSEAKPSGAMRCSCTKPSPAKRMAASAPASRQKPRCLSASRSMRTRCRPL